MYYTVIKHFSHLRTLEKCRKHSPAARVFYISVVFSNACRVLSQCNTRLRLLYLLTMITFLPLVYLSVSHRIPWRNQNRLQISALVPEIFKFEKWVKYANEITDDVIHSTQYYIEYINRAILANLPCKSLKRGRVTVLQETHLWL